MNIVKEKRIKNFTANKKYDKNFLVKVNENR